MPHHVIQDVLQNAANEHAAIHQGALDSGVLEGVFQPKGFEQVHRFGCLEF
jgi:hypothetical protein